VTKEFSTFEINFYQQVDKRLIYTVKRILINTSMRVVLENNCCNSCVFEFAMLMKNVEVPMVVIYYVPGATKIKANPPPT